MAAAAQYTAAPILDFVQISTANTNRDGTGTIGTVATGPATAAGNGVGKRINRVRIKAAGTTTAGMIRFYVSNDGGTTKRMITEVPVSAITVGASTAAFEAEVPALVGLILPGSSNGILYASTHNAETFNIICESGTL